MQTSKSDFDLMSTSINTKLPALVSWNVGFKTSGVFSIPCNHMKPLNSSFKLIPKNFCQGRNNTSSMLVAESGLTWHSLMKHEKYNWCL